MQGDQDEFVRMAQNVAKNVFYHLKKCSAKMWATFIIMKKLPKVNIRSLGENSPNLVTLHACMHAAHFFHQPKKTLW
jgi:hypothetical protein